MVDEEGACKAAVKLERFMARIACVWTQKRKNINESDGLCLNVSTGIRQIYF